jgi:hypothetical protein
MSNPTDNLDLRDELAGRMGWTRSIRKLTWYKGELRSVECPVPNTLDAASEAIKAAGWTWGRSGLEWFAWRNERTDRTAHMSWYQSTPDTGDDKRDLFKLAVAVYKPNGASDGK